MSNQLVKKFEEDLLSVKDRWQDVLPENITPQRFVSTVMMAVSKNPVLLKADRNSLVQACIQAASHGLLPDGREGAIMPFGDRKSGKQLAQWMPMVTGLVRRLRELGDLTSVSAYCVYKGDTFHVTLGDDPKIVHEVDPSGSRKGADIVAAYAIFKNGPEVIHREIMTRDEIEQARKVSRAANGPAWRDWYGEMARKTVLRRGSKAIPLSAAAAAIIENEDQWVDFDLKDDSQEVINPLNDDVPPKDVNADVEDAEIVDPVDLISIIANIESAEELEEFAAAHKEELEQLPEPLKGRVRSAYRARTKELREKAA
jgi:recombination protein RecT